jgi:hypothetical protein
MGLLLGAALGALAAGRGARTEEGPHRFGLLTDGLAGGALVAVAVVVATISENSAGLYRGGFLAIAALTALATACVARRGSRLGRALDRGPMRWIAARSYAIYLWHWPVAVVTRPGIDVQWPGPVVFAVRLGATVLLADLTYRAIERPVRSLGLRDSLRGGVRRVSRVVVGEAPVGARLATAGTLATVLVACAVLATGPKATLTGVQKALASEQGGRYLPLGSTRRPAAPDPLPIGRVSNVAAQSSTPPSPAPTTPHPTTPHPTRRPAVHHALPKISAYGDSVMLGARSSLDHRFPGGTLDAIEGRQPGPILLDVEHDAAAGRLNALVIIGVGDNGLISASALQQALTVLRHVHRVIVINNRVNRPWEAPNNHTIATVVPHFRNVRLLDWHRASARHSAWFFDDGIHLTDDGALAYARMIAATSRLR